MWQTDSLKSGETGKTTKSQPLGEEAAGAGIHVLVATLKMVNHEFMEAEYGLA